MVVARPATTAIAATAPIAFLCMGVSFRIGFPRAGWDPAHEGAMKGSRSREDPRASASLHLPGRTFVTLERGGTDGPRPERLADHRSMNRLLGLLAAVALCAVAC